jgi:DNA (cytosine-5)-methyltransferase 1
MAELGYGTAYRILDAQYFGVPQRRRRVFVVGCLGDWRRAAEVLFEPGCVRGDSAKGGKKRKDVAGTLASRSSAGGGLGTDFDLDGGLIATSTGNTSHCLNAGGMGRQDYETETMVVDNSKGIRQNETFEHQGFVPEFNYASEEEANTHKVLRALRDEIGEEAFAEWGLGILDSLQRPEVLRQALHGIGVRPATFSRSWPVHCAVSREEDRAEGVMRSLRELECKRRSSQRRKLPQQLARQLGAYLSKLPQPGAQKERLLCDLWKSSEGVGVLRQALSAIQEAWRPARGQSESAQQSHGVRRLTVEECESLQGFPRGYTLVPHRNKPAADGPRYKAIGNSMAVPVMRWIGERIVR